MKILFVAFMVLIVKTSGTSDTNNADHHDILFNYQSFEDDSNSRPRLRREVNFEETDGFYDDSQKRMEIESLQRMKRAQQKREINLPSGYSIYEIPKLPDKSPMPIFLHLNISKILDFDELNEVIKIDMEFKVMWTDFQILQFHNNTHPGNGIAIIDTLTTEEIKLKRKTDNDPALLMSIWKPNLFMEGLLSVTQPVLMAKPLTIRFIPELGWFEYVTRIQVKLDCSMDFQYYPADTQSCFLSIRGFSYTKANLNLTWYKDGVHLNNLDLQNFVVRVDDLIHFDLVKSDDPDEVFDVLGFKIIARRKLSYHLIQTYLSSSFYIVITTLCFLLPSTMVEARIGMSMTTLLTLTAMFAAVRESTPMVSYTKAIDIWMVGCIFFVFLTLFQFTFSTWLRHMEKSEPTNRRCDEKSKEISKEDSYEMDDPASNKSSKDSVGHVFSTRTIEICQRISSFLEGYSFPLFLMIYFVYSTVYWIWLLTASNYFNWNVNSTWNRV